jgi:hypothetical protein
MKASCQRKGDGVTRSRAWGRRECDLAAVETRKNVSTAETITLDEGSDSSPGGAEIRRALNALRAQSHPDEQAS